MQKTIGFLGLGNMGLNMVYHLLDQGYEVYAWNRSEEPRRKAEVAGAKVFSEIADLLEAMSQVTEQKIVWSMVAAGKPVDFVIEKLLESDSTKRRLGEGDIFVDGVNSHYQDSLRRHHRLGQQGVQMFDCGVSGGIEGARKGACIMVGGDAELFQSHLEQIVKDLAAPDAYGYFGSAGAGHYVKMVHNAIEYGMMQSLAEGINLLENSDYRPDYQKLADVWNHGSIIAGNLMGFLKDAFAKDASLAETKAEVGSLGTGKWSVAEALEREVPFNSIANAVFTRYASRESDQYIFKIVQALRTQFGGHSSDSRASGNIVPEQAES